MAGAFQIPGLKWSLPSSGKIPRYRFVSVTSDGTAALSTATSIVIGTSQNKTVVGETQEILSGLVIVEAAGAITPGTIVGSSADGKAVSGGELFVAITGSGAAGDLITVMI